MSEQPGEFQRGDVVQRKSGGPCGTIEEVYSVRGRMRATVCWHGNVRYRSGRTDQRSHILCRSLVAVRVATGEQIAEMDRMARALGYSGYRPAMQMTYERAEQRLADFRAGRVAPPAARRLEPSCGLVLMPLRSRRGY